MSKARDNWRPWVINVLRDYYLFKRLDKEAHTTRVTAQYNKGRGGGGPSRTTEMAALRTGLTRQQERELNAVEKALKTTRRGADGKIRVKVIELVYFRGTHTIEGAAQQVHVSYSTAWRWADSFVRLVGKYLGCES